MTILERLGRGLMLAVATPIMFAEEVLSTRDDIAREREARAKAEGERDEARRYLREAAMFAKTCEAAANEDAQRVFDLSKEVDRLREVERNGLADDEVYQHTAATLQDRTRERDELRTLLGRAEVRVCQLERERDELKKRLDARGEPAGLADTCSRLTSDLDIARDEAKTLHEQLAEMTISRDAWRTKAFDRKAQVDELQRLAAQADEEPAVDKCAWCLGDVDNDTYAVYENNGGESIEHKLCTVCGRKEYPDANMVRTRIMGRAASCPSRRVADPLSIECSECTANVGACCYT